MTAPPRGHVIRLQHITRAMVQADRDTIFVFGDNMKRAGYGGQAGQMQKAGLVDLVDDDRATLLGAFLELAGRLRDGDDDVSSADLMTRWRRRGLRAFDADRNTMAGAGRMDDGSLETNPP